MIEPWKKTWAVKEARHKGPHTIWLYLYEISRISKSTDRKKIEVIRSWGKRENLIPKPHGLQQSPGPVGTFVITRSSKEAQAKGLSPQKVDPLLGLWWIAEAIPLWGPGCHCSVEFSQVPQEEGLMGGQKESVPLPGKWVFAVPVLSLGKWN